MYSTTIACATTLLLNLLSFVVSGRSQEIPVVHGVPGGVPSRDLMALNRRQLDVDFDWENPLAVPGTIRMVENTGLCEKTPGVYDAAGYGDLSKTDSMWFWFFEARNDPDNAPLVLWFNGGPGSSSMYGLFNAHGPCRINNSTRGVHNNTFSWNTNANILYIDQPVGAGFSITYQANISTSEEAAVDVWNFMQIWLNDERFKKFVGRDMGIWAESYGGHYGPTFARYFLEQNDAIAANRIQAVPLNLTTLGIGNGLTDPLTQYAYYTVYSANNTYHPLVNNSVIETAEFDWLRESGCKDQIIACNAAGGNDTVCSDAQEYCNEYVMGTLYGKYDMYYVPSLAPNPYPADFGPWLNENRHVIQTQKPWSGSNSEIYWNFADSGDWMRSARPYLEEVIEKGVRVGIYAGDADFIVNHLGVEAMMENMETSYSGLYRQQVQRNYTVRGEVAGLYKCEGAISYLRIYGAGHMVPAYEYGNLARGEAALQMFEQVQMGDGLVPT